MARVRVEIDRARLEKLFTDSRNEASRNGALSASRKVKENITAKGRVDTGAMRNRVGARKGREGWWMVQGGAPYTSYQEFGTRAHGPVRAKYMRFKPKGSNTFVFAKWVRGVKPGNFFRDAMRSLKVSDFLP